MGLKLMYITNNPEIALIAEKVGVDRIWVDMEYIGKEQRQSGMDTVQCHHTLKDIANVRKVISKSEVMVRCNPIHDAAEMYGSSEEEINAIVEEGADIIMLPYFKTLEEVKKFIKYVSGRVRTLLLIETPEAVEYIDEILQLEGIDEVFVGLNDLSLAYGKKFMFELLEDGTVERLCDKFKYNGYSYGFGGIASLGQGKVAAENIIGEHYRLGSTCVILSRSFCDLNVIKNIDEVRCVFERGIKQIRDYEKFCMIQNNVFFEENSRKTKALIRNVSEEIK